MLTELRSISTYAALLPIITGLTVFKKAGVQYRLLLFMLIYGFLTDVLVGELYKADHINSSRFLYNLFAPVEAVLLSLFFYITGYVKIIRQIAAVCIFILPAAWIVLDFEFSPLKWVDTPYNGIYVTAYEIVIASLSAACILHLTTNSPSLTVLPQFWFLLAIFVYCFCTFFVNALVQTKVMEEIWFLHNIINIISYFIYTKAFLSIKNTGSQATFAG